MKEVGVALGKVDGSALLLLLLLFPGTGLSSLSGLRDPSDTSLVQRPGNAIRDTVTLLFFLNETAMKAIVIVDVFASKDAILFLDKTEVNVITFIVLSCSRRNCCPHHKGSKTNLVERMIEKHNFCFSKFLDINFMRKV